jgi:type VI secretion system protein ImpJ
MIERGNSFYLVFGSAVDPAVIRESLNTTAKLGSRESLPMLIARALPGITLAPLEAPPQELPRRAHSIYFKIDHHQESWGAVKQNKNIALFWDEAPEDLNVEMMVVEKR